MKVLKYAVITVVLLLSGFVFTGLFFPVIRYSNEILISAPIEKIFSVYSDTLRWKDYVSGIKNVRTVSGIPYTPGWKTQITIEDNDEIYEITETLTFFEKNRKYATKSENDILTSDSETLFVSEKNGTRIKSSTSVKGKNLFWRSVFIYSSEMFRDSQQEQLDSLKKICEKI